MITNVSERLAVIIGQYTEREEDTDYIRYGLEILIGGLVKMIVLFSSAYLLGVLQPMIWVFCTFALFRSLTGGHHYSTYGRCLVAGFILLVGIAYTVVKVESFVSLSNVTFILYVTTICGVVLAYKYAPSNHFYKKSTEKQKEKLRLSSFIAIACWFILIYYLIYVSYDMELILASIAGFLFQLSSLHPYTYKFVEEVEKILEREVNGNEKAK